MMRLAFLLLILACLPSLRAQDQNTNSVSDRLKNI